MFFKSKWIILSMLLSKVLFECAGGTRKSENIINLTTTDVTGIMTSVAKTVEHTTHSATKTVAENSTPLTVTKTITKTTGALQTETKSMDENTQKMFTEPTSRRTEPTTGKQAISTFPNATFLTRKMTAPIPPADILYTFILTMPTGIPTTATLYYFNPDLQTMENYIKTNRTVINYLAGFENEHQRNVVETQMKICPYVPLCGFPLNIDTDQLSCCEECNCNSSCFETRSCCPNVLHQSFSEFNNSEQNGISNVSTRVLMNQYIGLPQCISKHLTARPSRVQRGFYATASCPMDVNSELRVNCTRAYSEHTKFKAFLPVFSNTTLKVFRNQYCAICNGINYTDIMFFQHSFSCSAGQWSVFDVTSEKDITKLVFATEECDITFESIDKRIQLNYCEYSISMCNVTGLWETYDPEIEHACLLYRSLFHHEQYVFQNVFCALCNGMTPHTVTCYYFHPADSDVFSFSGLMKLDHDQDFDATKTVGDDLAECSENQIFDFLMEECKDVYCSQMRMLKDGTCVNIYESIDGHISYLLNIRILPDSIVSLINMFEIESSLYDSLNNLFITLQLQLSICDFALAYTLEETYGHGNTRQLQNSVLAYADAKVLLAKHGTQKPWLIKEEIQNIHGTVVSLSYSNATVNFKLIIRDYDDSVFNVINTIVKSTPVVESLLRSVNVIEKVSTMSKFSFPSITGLTIVPSPVTLYIPFACIATEKDIYLQRFMSCPIVNMSRHTYLWTEKIDRITVGDTDIKSFEYYHIDKDHIMLCVDSFKKMLASLRPDRKFSVETIVSVVSSALSIVALFATIIVYCIIPELRKTLPGKNSLSLVISLFMAQIMFLVGSLNPFQQFSVECKVVGLIIHFSWLCSIFWMNVCTYYMFRSLSTTKLVTHDKGWKRFMHYITYVFIMAIVFVAANVIISISVSGEFGYGGKFCYITSQNRILFTFVLPALLVIFTNLSMFLFVMIRIKMSSHIQKNVQNERNELLIFAKLSTITGITWVFGFLYTWTGILTFSFIFILLTASQGVFIMFALVVNRRVLSLCKSLTKSKTKTPKFKINHNNPSTVTTNT